jgi:putative endonuclease
MFCVYVLQSQIDQSFYIGITENLQRRLEQHNDGSSRHTSSKRPYVMVWYGAFKTKELALSFEKYLKSSSGFAFRNKRLV